MIQALEAHTFQGRVPLYDEADPRPGIDTQNASTLKE
jgi:hypothetical protein